MPSKLRLAPATSAMAIALLRASFSNASCGSCWSGCLDADNSYCFVDAEWLKHLYADTSTIRKSHMRPTLLARTLA
eukprot:2053473-Pleurochrysis_carterae.AAC.1